MVRKALGPPSGGPAQEAIKEGLSEICRRSARRDGAFVGVNKFLGRKKLK